MYTAIPTKPQLDWHDAELGVIIHYCPEMMRPDLGGSWHKTSAVREILAPETLHPVKLDPEKWVRCAAEMGAKYAVFVANHATGFSMWDTKVNDFSIAHTDWRGGGGDACREFIDACKKYGVKPGFYYCTVCNGYYDIDNNEPQDFRSEKYQAYLKIVKTQVEELWSSYGEVFEIWFDGGVVSPKDGGIDFTPILRKFQPNAVCFQGPDDFEHNLRWVGNEDGLAPENCWGATSAGEANFDGTVKNEPSGVGDPDGKYYRPAESDMPNRSHEAFGGGWSWQPNEEKYLFSTEHLLDCYIRSVGHNSNMLLGMPISVDGDFTDEEQFKAFGECLRREFGSPVKTVDSPKLTDGRVEMSVNAEIKYVVIREDITNGRRVRGFKVYADGECVCEAQSLGHKRIIPVGGRAVKTVTLEITSSDGDVKIRDIAVC